MGAASPPGLGAAGLQAMVFALVAAAVDTAYLTQPMPSQLSREFGTSPPVASLTVSRVILGITLACLR